MGMRVTKVSLDSTLARFTEAPKIVGSVTEEVLSEAGADIVEKIRNGELSSWNNQSGSLRSSVGGGVTRKGVIVKSFGFGTILSGAEGSRKGRELLSRLALEYAVYDYALIIVAGEDYAVYVEAIEGKVVLSSARLRTDRALPRLLKERINQALRRL